MTKKDKGKDKSGRVIFFSIAVAVTVVTAVLLIMFLPPVIKADSERRAAESRFGDPDEQDLLLLTDPLYRESFATTGAELVIKGEERSELCRKVVYFLGNADYSGNERRVMGNWDISITLRSENEMTTVYFTEAGLYLAEEYDRFVFSPEDKVSAEYAEFYVGLKELIAAEESKK